MKIIAANGAKKNKSIQGKWQLNIEENCCLINHQHGANSNEQTGENEEVENFF